MVRIAKERMNSDWITFFMVVELWLKDKKSSILELILYLIEKGSFFHQDSVDLYLVE